MVTIAAAGDVHAGAHDASRVRDLFANVSEEADILLLAGDLTRHGTPDEMRAVASALFTLTIPVVTIFGNHDVHAGQERVCRKMLEDAGAIVLEREVATLTIRGTTIGVAGAKGFGGGFRGACASEFGEPEMRQFLAPTVAYGEFFARSLADLDTDVRIALMHYAPIPETLLGERWEIFPFLGAYQLGEALDAGGADLALHGHAHRGAEFGSTATGVPVRNVAQVVLGRPYGLYEVEPVRRTMRVPAGPHLVQGAMGHRPS